MPTLEDLDDLIDEWNAPVEPSSWTLHDLQHDEILEAVAAWDEDNRHDWEERAAVREYDGSLPRPEAEVLAYYDITKGGR